MKMNGESEVSCGALFCGICPYCRTEIQPKPVTICPKCKAELIGGTK